jgi:hypothetical protein
MRRALTAAVTALALCAGCSKDLESSKAPTGNGAVAPRTAPDPASASQSAPPSVAEDRCQVMNGALKGLKINWQLVAQLQDEPDVSKWSGLKLGDLDKLGDQVKALAELAEHDPDTKDALEFVAGAEEIVRNGVGGDASAPAALKQYLGGELRSVVLKISPVETAFGASGC